MMGVSQDSPAFFSNKYTIMSDLSTNNLNTTFEK